MIPLHGIATRDDLPLPFWLVLLAAATTLLVTFGVLALAWRKERWAEPGGTPMPSLGRIVEARWFRWVLLALTAALWLVATAALFLGPDRVDNPFPGFVFVWLWVGLVIMALLFGTVHRTTNPARTLTGTLTASEVAPSVLPGALALMGFSWFELVEPTATHLSTLRIAAAVWLAWVVAGRLVVGRTWLAAAEPFEVYANAVAKLSPWTRIDDTLTVTSPLRHLASWRPPRHTAVLTSVLLGGTLFDAVSASSWWVRATQTMPDRVPGTVGLLIIVGLIATAFTLCALPLRASGESPLAAADRLSPSLIPLVVGYVLAHYWTMFYLEGQRTAIRFSDPLSKGWNLLGISEGSPDTTLLAFPVFIAIAQVVCIVGGHVLGTLVTHDLAVRHHPGWRAQAPLLGLMVGLTLVGLVLMFGN